MENIKLSFIVPIYNVAPYLRKCVDSLLLQDYEDYEIILVDDGSSDSCPAICDDYLNHKFENWHANNRSSKSRLEICNHKSIPIRVIHQANAGLSAARNSGIRVANGEYICFVDSDDYWEENVLGELMAQIEQDNLDVLRFNYQNVRLVMDEGVNGLTKGRKYEVFQPNKDPKRDVDYSETVTDGETFLNERLGPMCYAVMFVIKRSLLVATSECLTNERVNECLFKEGIYFEDVDWTPRMLLRAKRVSSTPMIVYNYFWRLGSISLAVAPEKLRKIIEDKIELIRGFQEQKKKVRDSKWFEWMTSFTAMTILDVLTNFSLKERRTYVRELQLLDIFPLMTKKEKIQSHKIKVQVANISPLLYCKIMKMVKRVKCNV